MCIPCEHALAAQRATNKERRATSLGLRATNDEPPPARHPSGSNESPSRGGVFIGSIRERLSIVALNGGEYVSALQASSARGIVGGGIYDALLAHCATKAQAEIIYTWNVRHYALCAPK